MENSFYCQFPLLPENNTQLLGFFQIFLAFPWNSVITLSPMGSRNADTAGRWVVPVVILGMRLKSSNDFIPWKENTPERG